MNCKPGDLAVIVREASRSHSTVLGMIVEVIAPAPLGEFRLPNGQLHMAASTSSFRWLCRATGQGFPTFVFDDGVRLNVWNEFAPLPDMALRPLRPGDDDEEDDVRVSKPVEECAA